MRNHSQNHGEPGAPRRTGRASPRARTDWRALVAVLVLAWIAGRAVAAAPPNIVFMLADDLGWSDLGCYGADLHETPRLDRLARQGVRFTQAYAMPVCSPTRAGLLTGRHPARLHYTTWREAAVERSERVAQGNWRLIPPPTVADLPASETTIATRLHRAGYLTFHVGKWHLGDANHSPETHGFDVNIGGTHWGAPESYFWPFRGTNRFREFRYVPGLGPGHPGQHLTDRLTDEAIKLIDFAGDRPFFLNLWFHNPHTPVEPKPELAARFRAKLQPGFKHQNADYAALLATLDENVGRVLDHLDQRGLAGRTVVIFASDNGGYLGEYKGQRVSNNAPLRSGKGSVYEGGIRVPLMIRWPGHAPAGRVCDEPVSCVDLAPSLAEFAGLPADEPTDGLSLAPLLRDPAGTLPRDALYFHYPHYYATTTPAGAVRSEGWKLIEYFEDSRLELYNLRADPGEAANLAAQEPDRTRALHARLREWRSRVGAQLPSPNPDYRAPH